MMKVDEFCDKLIACAKDYKTLYIMGCFGAPMTPKNKTRYTSNHSYNKNTTRAQMINNATEDTFGFDCVCLIKGILWGWNGDTNKIYGGATYASNNVPDIDCNAMLNTCSEISTNFCDIEKGCAVWMQGHIGVYVGNGMVVECTPKWENKVQLTYLGNFKEYRKGNYRIWTKFGKFPYVDYTNATYNESKTLKSNLEIANEVINGRWGNGVARKEALTNAGYNYSEVQKLVNQILKNK